MKKTISIIITLLLLQSAHAKIQDVDRVVAVVNDGVITLSSLDFRVKDTQIQMSAEARKNVNLAQLRTQVLQRMIEEEVLIQYARDMGISISETEVDKYITGITAQQKLSVDNFYKEAQKQGLSRDTLREEIKNNLMTEQLKQREINSRITVTDSEVNQEMGSSHTALKNQQIRLSAVLVPLSQKPTADEMKSKAQTAEMALAEIAAGQDFGAVAKKYSSLSNKNNGGDMGFQSASRLPADLTSLISALAIGQHTQIVQTPEGFYIFKLTERKETGKTGNTQMVKTYRAEHILIKVNDLTSDEQALTRINDIERRLKQGGNFEALARQYSEDGSAIQGGSLGWVRPGDTVPEFEQGMIKLNLNQVSAPVRTPFGYHLIKVVETRDEDVGLAQRKNQIRQQIAERKGQQIYKEWVEQLVAGSYVVNKLHDE